MATTSSSSNTVSAPHPAREPGPRGPLRSSIGYTKTAFRFLQLSTFASYEAYIAYCMFYTKYHKSAEYVATTPLLAAAIAAPIWFLSASDTGLGSRKNVTIGGNFKDYRSALGLLFWWLLWWTSLFATLLSFLYLACLESRITLLTVFVPPIVTTVTFFGTMFWLMWHYRRFGRAFCVSELPNLALEATTVIAFWVATAWLSAAYVRCETQVYYALLVTALALAAVYGLAGAFGFGTLRDSSRASLEQRLAATHMFRNATIVPVFDSSGTTVIGHSVTVRLVYPGAGTIRLIGVMIFVIAVLWVPVKDEVNCFSCWHYWLRETYHTLRDDGEKTALHKYVLTHCERASSSFVETMVSVAGSAAEAYESLSAWWWTAPVLDAAASAVVEDIGDGTALALIE